MNTLTVSTTPSELGFQGLKDWPVPDLIQFKSGTEPVEVGLVERIASSIRDKILKEHQTGEVLKGQIAKTAALDQTLHSPYVEVLKGQIVEAYQEALGCLEGVHRVFVLFGRPENPEYGVLDCTFFFFVSKNLYFKIERLYSQTDSIRDFFENEKDVCIFYHFDPYSGQSVEEIVPDEAQEIYLVRRESLSTASEFYNRREKSRFLRLAPKE